MRFLVVGHDLIDASVHEVCEGRVDPDQAFGCFEFFRENTLPVIHAVREAVEVKGYLVAF